MENIWGILGIAPTTDTSLIQQAFASGLKICNPEENAEQFQALKEAYETAMMAASQADIETNTNEVVEEGDSSSNQDDEFEYPLATNDDGTRVWLSQKRKSYRSPD